MDGFCLLACDHLLKKILKIILNYSFQQIFIGNPDPIFILKALNPVSLTLNGCRGMVIFCVSTSGFDPLFS